MAEIRLVDAKRTRTMTAHNDYELYLQQFVKL